MSEKKAAVKNIRLKPLVWTSIIVVVIFFGVFGAWAALAPLHSAAILNGKLIVSTERKLVQHYEGGIVHAIYVKDGALVKKGEPLLQLDRTRSAAESDVLKGEQNALLAQEGRLLAVKYDTDKIHFSPDLLSQPQTSAIRGMMKSQQAIFEADKKSIDTLEYSTKQQIGLLVNQVQSIMDQAKSEEHRKVLLEQELSAVKTLLANNHIAKVKVWELEGEYAFLQGKISEHHTRIAQVMQQVEQLKLGLDGEVGERAEQNAEELDAVQRDLVKVKEQLKQAGAVLNRTLVLAPQNGVVVDSTVHTVGAVIQPGETLMEIVPQEDQIVVEANLEPRDIDIVHPGLPARVKLLPYSFRNTPDVMGKVTYVAADASVDEEGGSFYELKLKLDGQSLKKVDNVALYPGMPVQVMVVTSHQTFLQYLWQPLKSSVDRAFREA